MWACGSYRPHRAVAKAVLLRTPDCSGNTSFEMSVAFSPDGRTVAAGRVESYFEKGGNYLSSASVVSLYDLAAGRERLTIKGEIDENCAVAFSPDGRTIAVGLGRAVKLYDPDTGQGRAALSADDAFGFLGLAFSSDGHILAAATISEGVSSWDMRCGVEVGDVSGPHPVAVRGGRLAGRRGGPPRRPTARSSATRSGRSGSHSGSSGRRRGLRAGLRDRPPVRCGDGEEAASLKHAWTASSVSFSADGKLLASGGGGAAKLWDLTTNETRTMTNAKDGLDVYCVAFSPDGRTLAVGVGSRDFGGSFGEVRLWNVGFGRVRVVLKGDAGKNRSLAFAPDGKMLVTGSSRAVVLWDVPPANSQAAESGVVAAEPL